jgi:hypothetical protein
LQSPPAAVFLQAFRTAVLRSDLFVITCVRFLVARTGQGGEYVQLYRSRCHGEARFPESEIFLLPYESRDTAIRTALSYAQFSSESFFNFIFNFGLRRELSNFVARHNFVTYEVYG